MKRPTDLHCSGQQKSHTQLEYVMTARHFSYYFSIHFPIPFVVGKISAEALLWPVPGTWALQEVWMRPAQWQVRLCTAAAMVELHRWCCMVSDQIPLWQLGSCSMNHVNHVNHVKHIASNRMPYDAASDLLTNQHDPTCRDFSSKSCKQDYTQI